MRGSANIELRDHAHIAIVGGGPAGSFTALHLLQLSQQLGKPVTITLFERRCRPDSPIYSGCPQCAGGLSPRLCEALDRLGVRLPAETVQAHIHSITLHGHWKYLQMPVPEHRCMLSVFRGTLPYR